MYLTLCSSVICKYWPVLLPQAATIPSAQSLRLMDYSFSDFDLTDAETTQATIRMFVDLKLVQNFQIKYKVPVIFCYLIQRLYYIGTKMSFDLGQIQITRKHP